MAAIFILEEKDAQLAMKNGGLRVLAEKVWDLESNLRLSLRGGRTKSSFGWIPLSNLSPEGLCWWARSHDRLISVCGLNRWGIKGEVGYGEGRAGGPCSWLQETGLFTLKISSDEPRGYWGIPYEFIVRQSWREERKRRYLNVQCEGE